MILCTQYYNFQKDYFGLNYSIFSLMKIHQLSILYQKKKKQRKKKQTSFRACLEQAKGCVHFHIAITPPVVTGDVFPNRALV